MERNKDREKREGPPTPNSAIQLPFIIVNTSKKTVIDCSISNDKMEYLFNFDDTFEIHDDMEVKTLLNKRERTNLQFFLNFKVFAIFNFSLIFNFFRNF